MTIKVYISPDYRGVPKHMDNGGIRRVVEAQVKHLPQFGVEVVDDPRHADIINNHGSMMTSHPGVPIVHTGHGLYWSRQPWGDGYQEVNEQVTQSMAQAVAHTAPSEWVSRAIRRGGYWYPEVIYHGVDHTEFKPAGQHDGYVIWNKARADYVSDPTDMMRLASLMQDVRFESTVGMRSKNVNIFGTLSHMDMLKKLSHAGVYLCTVRETFGIGTLEAMAYGIPIAGWDWGGQHEIIVQGQTGYLAPPGDYNALQECVRKCFDERERLSANCIDDVRNRWGWEPRIQQYADLYKRVYEKYVNRGDAPKVTVLVTAYKLDEFLPVCLDSVKAQTMPDLECLVVDDAQLESTRLIVNEYRNQDDRFHYVPTPRNMGLPGARNFGAEQARGLYVRHLDADDFLAPNALELESKFLDENPGVHIAYGHLEVFREDGTRIMEHGSPVRSEWPPAGFSWQHQMAHLNQIPSCVMARKDVFEKSGGYRTRMHRNEDAEFWCRVTSLGFRADKFTQAVTYFHIERHDSKGALEWKTEGKEPDWTAWFPWRMGASDYREATEVFRKFGGNHPNPILVPFGAQGRPTKRKFWYVNDYAYPVASVIVTCGPGHKQYLLDALDSIQAQTFPDWECVVVNDTGEEWGENINGAPWAKVVSTGGNRGASAARNAGYRHTHGKYVIWMDADDYWLPWFLDKMVAYAEQNKGVIFSDILMYKEKKFNLYRYAEFDCQAVTQSMRYPGSSILVPREIADSVFNNQGGWDEQIPGMEDYDFQFAVHTSGFCAYRIPEPLFVYRMETSTKRENDYQKIDAIVEYINKKWYSYRTGEKPMACGCSGGKRSVVSTAVSKYSASGDFQPEAMASENSQTVDQMVAVEYVGPVEATFSIRSRAYSDVTYRFGNNDQHRAKTVLLSDAEYLISMTDGDGVPLYRIIGGRSSVEINDPTSFIGQAIVA